MILIDTPQRVTFRRFQRASHMASDLLGAAGTRELHRFARDLGLQSAWIQREGAPTEHFDVFDGVYDRAVAAGAVEVTPREFVTRVVAPKRQAQAQAEAGRQQEPRGTRSGG